MGLIAGQVPLTLKTAFFLNVIERPSSKALTMGAGEGERKKKLISRFTEQTDPRELQD